MPVIAHGSLFLVGGPLAPLLMCIKDPENKTCPNLKLWWVFSFSGLMQRTRLSFFFDLGENCLPQAPKTQRLLGFLIIFVNEYLSIQDLLTSNQTMVR